MNSQKSAGWWMGVGLAISVPAPAAHFVGSSGDTVDGRLIGAIFVLFPAFGAALPRAVAQVREVLQITVRTIRLESIPPSAPYTVHGDRS